MNAEKLFNDAEKRNEYNCQTEIAENWLKENRQRLGLPAELPSGLTKGPFIRALCKIIRELIPDGECIEFPVECNPYEVNGVTHTTMTNEVDGLDIAVFLLMLTNDIPENTPMCDPRPADDEPDFIDETDLTKLRELQIKLPEGW